VYQMLNIDTNENLIFRLYSDNKSLHFLDKPLARSEGGTRFDMEKTIRHNITKECNKLIERYYEYLFELEETTKRKEERLGSPVDKKIIQPDYWTIKGFNPFKVNRTKQINTYAYTISNRLKLLSYKPQSSIIYSVPKSSGGTRDLNIFQIPDSAISRMVYKSLLEKNVNLFSGYAYAYREDRNAHDAIMRISSDWRTRDRVYVAEFDFSKYFDKIDHLYLWDILRNHGFLYTEMEECVINGFLQSRYNDKLSYNPTSGFERKRGIPQGTSISLFLANVACWELDQELEHIGVMFARYADDTLIWSNSYEQVVRAYDAISRCSKQIGVPINFDKSEGITIVSERAREEIKCKTSVIYLGYDIGLRNVSICHKTVMHIQNRISYIIYENLIKPINQGVYNSNRLDLIDWDYLVALSQIRRYLYGGLNDTNLRQFRIGIVNQLRFRGVMSYYPLVNDEKQLKKLDGWLIYTLSQALKRRQNLWNKKGMTLPGPIENWIENITSIKKWRHPISYKIYDFRIPSFLQINRTIRVGLKQSGVNRVTNPRSVYYSGPFIRRLNK
jgi:RNA-directed DNA polymerase